MKKFLFVLLFALFTCIKDKPKIKNTIDLKTKDIEDSMAEHQNEITKTILSFYTRIKGDPEFKEIIKEVLQIGVNSGETKCKNEYESDEKFCKTLVNNINRFYKTYVKDKYEIQENQKEK